MADYKDVWVYVEHKEGAFTPMSYELFGIGQKLAADLGANLCALVIAENTDELAKEAGYYGASKVYAVDGAPFKTFRPDAYAKAATTVMDKYKPDVVLYRATTQGADLSAACAATLETGMASDAIGLEIDDVQSRKSHKGGFWRELSGGCRQHEGQAPDGDGEAQGLSPWPNGTPRSRRKWRRKQWRVAEDDLRTKVLQFMKSEVDGQPRRSGYHRLRWKRRGQARGFQDTAGAGQYARGRPRRITRGRRLGLDTPGAPGGPDGKNGETEDIYRMRHFRCHPAPGGYENIRLHRRHQQRR